MSTQKAKFELYQRLQRLGFTYDEAAQLRRIEMTLQRWAEAECGDANGNAIERGEGAELQLINWPDAAGDVWLVEKREGGLTPIRQFPTKDLQDPIALRALRRKKAQDLTGVPYRTFDLGRNGERGRYRIADREAGALRRLKAIVAARNHREERTEFMAANAQDHVFAYHQSDPRGCALYLVTRAQLGSDSIDSCYTRGLAVCT